MAGDGALSVTSDAVSNTVTRQAPVVSNSHVLLVPIPTDSKVSTVIGLWGAGLVFQSRRTARFFLPSRGKNSRTAGQSCPRVTQRGLQRLICMTQSFLQAPLGHLVTMIALLLPSQTSSQEGSIPLSKFLA